MRTNILYFAFLLLFTAVSSQAMAGTWIADSSGCKVFNPSPKPGETISWSGKCLDGYANGEGTLNSFRDGKPDEHYEGLIVLGKFQGKGVLTSSDGIRYQGNFVDSLPHGNGTVDSKGFHFEGEFIKGSPTIGKGSLDTHGIIFVGEFANGMPRNGKISFVDKTGNSFEGNLEDGEVSRKGKMSSESGEQYEGDFVKFKPQGKGVLVFKNGDHYEGDFIDGKAQGKGTYIATNGDRYTGDFVNFKRQGRGILTYINGDHYEGDFVDGKRHGRGILIYSNGDRYEGNFIDDKPQEK